MTGARTRSTFDLVDRRRSIANWRIDGAGMGRLPAQRARPSGAPTRLAKLQSRLEACLTALRIRHRTTYAYRRRVNLGPHRLMLRPRESRDLRLISSEIKVTPAGALTWAQDVFGNDVATVTFSAMTDVLAIDAAAELELHASAWPVFEMAASAIVYPFRYSDDDWTDLGATTVQQYADPDGRLRRWA